MAVRALLPKTLGSLKPSMLGFSHISPFRNNLGPQVRENQCLCHSGLPSTLAVTISGLLPTPNPRVVPKFSQRLYLTNLPPATILPITVF